MSIIVDYEINVAFFELSLKHLLEFILNFDYTQLYEYLLCFDKCKSFSSVVALCLVLIFNKVISWSQSSGDYISPNMVLLLDNIS